jgi:hypothetical protein
MRGETTDKIISTVRLIQLCLWEDENYNQRFRRRRYMISMHVA